MARSQRLDRADTSSVTSATVRSGRFPSYNATAFDEIRVPFSGLNPIGGAVLTLGAGAVPARSSVPGGITFEAE